MSDSPIPEPDNQGRGDQEQVEDASIQMVDQDLIRLQQKRESNSQITNEDLVLLNQSQDSGTRMTNEDFVPPIPTTLDARIQTPKGNLSILEKPNLKGNDSAEKLKNQNFGQNRKRSMPNDTIQAQERHSPKQPRSDTCKTNQNAALTLNRKVGINPDPQKDTSRKTYMTGLHKSYSTGSFSDSRNNENSHSQIPVVKAHDNIKHKKLLVSGTKSASDKNISQNKNSADRESVAIASKEKSGKEPENCETFKKLVITLNKKMGTKNENISQNTDSPAKLSDPVGSKRKSGFSTDDIRARPGSSRTSENVTQKTLSTEDIQSRLIEQSVKELKKMPKCPVCDKKSISKHEHVCKEKKGLRCCRCKYSCVEEETLLRHMCMLHLSEPFFCNICSIRYAKIGSHESEHKCDVCKMKFQCITQLEDHYIVHEKHHRTFCIICKLDIYSHGNKRKGKLVYKCCCKCPKEFYQKLNFRNHLYTHATLRLFKCKYCGKRFNQNSNKWAHTKTHPRCKICGKIFIDRNSVDAHRLKEHK